ncbi:hypothetical protein F4810DRAFT_434127 [Camillea tinctor]|nr:hypothetical protein F4810DRAFT_434127 [Camillea tinctor]
MPLGTLSITDDSVPVFSPTYPNAKSSFTGLTIIGITYRVAVSEIRHLVPNVLELDEEPIMTSLFVEYGMSSVGAYSEFVHQVEVSYKGERFDYNLILILDNEAAIFAGRELYGYPKVFGNTTIEPLTGSRLVLGGAERPT